jgi:hypothetical protein
MRIESYNASSPCIISCKGRGTVFYSVLPSVRRTEPIYCTTTNSAFHHVVDEVKEGRIQVYWVPGENMLADGMTKPLPREAFERNTHIQPFYEESLLRFSPITAFLPIKEGS